MHDLLASHVLGRIGRHSRVAVRRHARVHTGLGLVGGHHVHRVAVGRWARGERVVAVERSVEGEPSARLRPGSGRVAGARQAARCIGCLSCVAMSTATATTAEEAALSASRTVVR